jgi:uncharacterized protein
MMDYDGFATRGYTGVRETNLLSQVYAWMTTGLLVTSIVAALTVYSATLSSLVLDNAAVFIGLLILELILVFTLSATAARLSPGIAATLFMLYATLNGVTLSAILLIYTGASIASTFFVTAATFAAMSIYGFTTKRDLTRIGSLALMALIGIILASLVNLFFESAAVYWIVTYLGVAIFVGLTAADTQKIKRVMADADEMGTGNVAIIGALTLYLDFINLFLFLLRIFGRTRTRD